MSDEIREDQPPVGFKLPLLFTYRDTVFGNGFVAHVQARNGRLLCVHENDGFWMYGLNPGGMASTAGTPDGAFRAFRRTFSNVLIDLASEARDFDEFKMLVAEFFTATNAGYEDDWQEAVQRVRDENITVEGLKKRDADAPRSLVVELKHEFTVKDNRAAVRAKIAA